MEDDKSGQGSGTFMARVIRLAGLVEYQAQAIVSRVVLEKKAGSVTLFSFDKGQGLSEHTAPFDAVCYLIDGQAEVTISGKPMRLKEGDMVIMPANEPHSLKGVDRFKMVLTMIRSG